MEFTLPYDNEMENAVLGSVITNEKYFESVEKYFTNKDVFYQTRAQMLWKRISSMKKENKFKLAFFSFCKSFILWYALWNCSCNSFTFLRSSFSMSIS